jgi:hypothetical protein
MTAELTPTNNAPVNSAVAWPMLGRKLKNFPYPNLPVVLVTQEAFWGNFYIVFQAIDSIFE